MHLFMRTFEFSMRGSLFTHPHPILPATIHWMNPAALYLASGDSLYPGAVLLLSAAIPSPSVQNRGLRVLRGLATWLGFALIVMASPPVSGWVAAVFLVAFALWLITADRLRAGVFWARMRSASAATMILWLLVVPVSELLHRRMPRVEGKSSDHLVVIGDSFSAGIDSQTPAWPALFQHQTNVAVQNLSRPGAGVVEARAQASRVDAKATLILIEIGGNDLLAGMSSAEFGEALNSLLASLSTPEHTLVMFELPLLPHKIGFGQMQRRLSAKYGVFLIPRHFFTSVLSGTDATSDGLHLSDLGARRMATLVERALLLPPAPAPVKLDREVSLFSPRSALSACAKAAEQHCKTISASAMHPTTIKTRFIFPAPSLWF